MLDGMRATSVCVVEDDDTIRGTLRMLLEDEGYRVVEAATGLEGLAVLQGSRERLVVLLDHKLPELDGCDLLEIVAREEALRARHAIILVTASPERAEEDCGESLEELGAPLMSKPFDLDEMLEAVADAAHRIAVN